MVIRSQKEALRAKTKEKACMSLCLFLGHRNGCMRRGASIKDPVYVSGIECTKERNY